MPRFLIVEDNAVNREFMLVLLESRGECVCAQSGEEALTLFTAALKDNAPYDCVFMDIMLPGIDGLQTLETMRAVEREQGVGPNEQSKAIITSALDNPAQKNRAFFQGQAISYLTKPFTIRKVREELDNFGL